MGFLKSFFGGKDESPEEKKEREDARNFDVLKTDGVHSLRMGRGEHAVMCFTKALEIKVMARVDYMMEDYAAMAMVCEKATLIDNENAEVMFLYARAMKGQHDLVNAVAMYTKAIMLNEHFADAYLERGRLLLEMGDVEGAEEDANLLVEAAPDAEEVLLFKAEVLVAQKRQSEAIAVYDKAIEGNPFCVAALKGRGALRLAIGDKEGAENDMRQLLEVDPAALDHINGQFEG